MGQCRYPLYTDLGHGNFKIDQCPNDAITYYCEEHKEQLQQERTDFLEPPQTTDGNAATHRTRG
jgi:hypothetical protein